MAKILSTQGKTTSDTRTYNTTGLDCVNSAFHFVNSFKVILC